MPIDPLRMSMRRCPKVEKNKPSVHGWIKDSHGNTTKLKNEVIKTFNICIFSIKSFQLFNWT